jgi:hypothetical protein
MVASKQRSLRARGPTEVSEMDHELDRESVDSQAARLLTVWGQRSSRRGLLAIVGKFALRLDRLSMLPLLPVDRVFAAVADCALDWRLCGMWGRFCKDCCNQTASLYNCPTCTLQGSFWSFCCCHNVNCTTECETISYLIVAEPRFTGPGSSARIRSGLANVAGIQ